MMHHSDTDSEANHRQKMKQSSISLIMLFSFVLLAFILPVGVTTLVSGIGEINQRLVAPVWLLHLSGPNQGIFEFDILLLNLTLYDLLSQLLLAVTASVYYLGLIGRKPMVLSGFVSPVVYMRGLFTAAESFELWMRFPIPIMFVIVVLLLIFYPVTKEK